MTEEKIRHMAFTILKMREDLGYELQDSIYSMPEIIEYMKREMDKDKKQEIK